MGITRQNITNIKKAKYVIFLLLFIIILFFGHNYLISGTFTNRCRWIEEIIPVSENLSSGTIILARDTFAGIGQTFVDNVPKKEQTRCLPGFENIPQEIFSAYDNPREVEKTGQKLNSLHKGKIFHVLNGLFVSDRSPSRVDFSGMWNPAFFLVLQDDKNVKYTLLLNAGALGLDEKAYFVSFLPKSATSSSVIINKNNFDLGFIDYNRGGDIRFYY